MDGLRFGHGKSFWHSVQSVCSLCSVCRPPRVKGLARRSACRPLPGLLAIPPRLLGSDGRSTANPPPISTALALRGAAFIARARALPSSRSMVVATTTPFRTSAVRQSTRRLARHTQGFSPQLVYSRLGPNIEERAFFFFLFIGPRALENFEETHWPALSGPDSSTPALTRTRACAIDSDAANRWMPCCDN